MFTEAVCHEKSMSNGEQNTAQRGGYFMLFNLFF